MAKQTTKEEDFLKLVNILENRCNPVKKQLNTNPMKYDNEKKEYSIDTSIKCFEKLQDVIEIITPFLQTNSQIRNMKFLSIFNRMYILFTKLRNQNIITAENSADIEQLIFDVENTILH